jgi:hypothetical protein
MHFRTGRPLIEDREAGHRENGITLGSGGPALSANPGSRRRAFPDPVELIGVPEHVTKSPQIIKESTQLRRQHRGANLRDFQKHLREQLSMPLCRIGDVVFKRARCRLALV